MFYIYKITNLITNKIYVGQRKFKGDVLDDKYFGSGLYLRNSIKKHGRENFKKEILKDNIENKIDANLFEQFFIEKEKSLFPCGYNLTKGGDGGPGGKVGHKHSQETKLKLSIARKKRIITEKTKKKVSETMKGKAKPDGYWEKWIENRKGYKHSEETKNKIGLKSKGRVWSEETRNKILESRRRFYEKKNG